MLPSTFEAPWMSGTACDAHFIGTVTCSIEGSPITQQQQQQQLIGQVLTSIRGHCRACPCRRACPPSAGRHQTAGRLQTAGPCRRGRLVRQSRGLDPPWAGSRLPAAWGIGRRHVQSRPGPPGVRLGQTCRRVARDSCSCRRASTRVLQWHAVAEVTGAATAPARTATTVCRAPRLRTCWRRASAAIVLVTPVPPVSVVVVPAAHCRRDCGVGADTPAQDACPARLGDAGARWCSTTHPLEKLQSHTHTESLWRAAPWSKFD